MKKILLWLCTVAFVFLFMAEFGQQSFADEQEVYYSFYAEDEEEALRVSKLLGGELLGVTNGIAEIRVSRDAASEIENSIESGDELPVKLYPDITYSMDIEAYEGEYELWYLDAVNIYPAWEIAKGTGIKVAIVDSGIDLDHSDLSSGIISATTTIPSSAYGTGGFFKAEYEGPQDFSSHGTHVAGIIGARKNDIGITGIAPECSIISIKATEYTGTTSQGKTAWVAAGIREAVSCGAQVINLSIGGSVTDDTLLKNEIDAAVSAGVVVVVAACNTNGVSTVMYPAAYDNVITVSALKRSGDTVAFASSYSNHGSFVNISAPGSDIMSTVPSGYGNKNGTSMAAPMVSGAVADLLSKDSSLSVSEVKDLLYTSAKDMGPSGYDTKYGHGALDVGNLLSPYSDNPTIGMVYAEVPSGKSVTSGEKLKLFHDTVGGKILYTTVSDDISDEPQTYTDGVILSGSDNITVKAMVQGRNGEHGEVSEYTYTLLPDVTEIEEGLFQDERIADLAKIDPVMELPCRRYHIVLPAEKRLTVKTTKHSGDVTTYLFNRDNWDASPAGEYKNGGWILKNTLLYDRDIWISVLDTDGENLNNICAYDLQVLIEDITDEPSVNPNKPADDDTEPENPSKSDIHKPGESELLIMPNEYAQEDTEADDFEEDVPENNTGEEDNSSGDWIYVQSENKEIKVKNDAGATDFAKNSEESVQQTDTVGTILKKEDLQQEEDLQKEEEDLLQGPELIEDVEEQKASETQSPAPKKDEESLDAVNSYKEINTLEGIEKENAIKKTGVAIYAIPIFVFLAALMGIIFVILKKRKDKENN